MEAAENVSEQVLISLNFSMKKEFKNENNLSRREKKQPAKAISIPANGKTSRRGWGVGRDPSHQILKWLS